MMDDDIHFIEPIKQALEKFGHRVTLFLNGQECIQYLSKNPCDVCIFDWHLPDIHGDQVMMLLKSTGRMPPVIFLTGNDSEEAITNILLTGADDYIVKPPSISVLNARIRALMRRSSMERKPLDQERIGDFFVDYSNKQILKNDRAIALTNIELTVALEIFKHRGQIVSRSSLYQLLGIHEVAVDTRRLDVHISHIRKKLELSAMNGWRISSVYQRGYRLEFLAGEDHA
jgi:DNA-binding response OmpR family regulator